MDDLERHYHADDNSADDDYTCAPWESMWDSVQQMVCKKRQGEDPGKPFAVV
jgi:hypothetical protein